MNSVFARRQLEKHGWTDGDGLGRQRNGMAQPIKVNLKMDKTGVGHDPGKEFTDHWWMRAFNDAAKKIKKADESLQKEENEETKRKVEMSAKRKTFYKGFVKGSTLTNGCETKDSDQCSSEDEETKEKDVTSIPTLDDLHKFCDGATGHRAARFGIKMKGKLSRVAAHDKEFEEQSKIDPEISYVKKQKRKGSATECSISSGTQAMDQDAEMSQNSSEKIKVTESESQEDIEASLKPEILTETEKKKKKKRKKEKDYKELENTAEDSAHDLLIAESELNKEIGGKRKKKRKTEAVLEEAVENGSDNARKTETDNKNLTNDMSDDPESESSLEKSRNKKKRKANILVKEAAINDDDSSSPGKGETGERNLKNVMSCEPQSQGKKGTKKKKRRKADFSVDEAVINDNDSTSTGIRGIDDRSDMADEHQSKEQSGSKKKKKTDTLGEEAAMTLHDSTSTCDIETDGRNFKNDILDGPENQEQPKSKKRKKKIKDLEKVLPTKNCDVEDSLRKEKRKKDKKRKAEEPSEVNTKTLHKTKLVDIRMSNEVNDCGNDEKSLYEETPIKKKKKSQDLNLNCKYLPMLNDGLCISSNIKSHLRETDCPNNGIGLVEEKVEKKKKRKKKK